MCGGITLLRGQWFGLLGRDQVTAEVARNYVYELSVGGAEPPGPVLPVEVALVPVRSNLRPVGELVSAAARARNGKPPEFDGEALACVVFDCSVRSGHLLIERVIEQTLERVSSEGPMPASRELAAFTDALSANIDEAQAAETRAAVSASKSRLRLTAAIAALFPDTLTGRIEFFLSGPRRSAGLSSSMRQSASGRIGPRFRSDLNRVRRQLLLVANRVAHSAPARSRRTSG